MDERTLLRYLEGSLDAKARMKLEEELQHNPTLRRHLDELRAVERHHGTAESMVSRSESPDSPVHHHHSTQAREKYSLPQLKDIVGLSDIYSTEWPLVSFYADLRPEYRSGSPVFSRLRALIQQAEEQLDIDQRSHSYREAWRDEVSRLTSWFEAERVQGRGLGLCILSCKELGFWNVYELPEPVEDALVVGNRFELRSLLGMLSRHKRSFIILADSRQGRLMECYLNQIEEVTELESPVPSADGSFGDKVLHRHEQGMHQHIKILFERALKRWEAGSFDYIVLGGTEEALGVLRQQTPKTLQEHIRAELILSPQADLPHVLEHIRKIEHAEQLHRDIGQISALLNVAGEGLGVFGVEDTLLTVVEGRVRLLVVAGNYRETGWECTSCLVLGTGQQQACPICSGELMQGIDVISRAISRTLAQGGEILVLEDLDICRAFSAYGHIAALLRYPYTTNTEAEGTATRERGA